MQKLWVRVHRWLGLATAVFLFIAGLTGAIIAWDHELDAMLNPHLFEAPGEGPVRSSLELARELEAREPRLFVRYLPLSVEPDHALTLYVAGRVDPATNKPFELEHNQVLVDPRTGEVKGRRKTDATTLSRETLLPFLYRLHYTLHLPTVGGFDLGRLFMGIVAVAWLLDGVVALWISFPSLKVWRKSFAFRLRQGTHKLTFDLHRSSGVWTWALLTVLAFTAVSMNLNRELVRPLVEVFSPLAPNPFARRPGETPRPGPPALSRADILARAQDEAARLGITAPPGGLLYNAPRHLYGIGFFAAGMDHGDGGLGNPRLVFDGDTGALVTTQMPGEGSAGDVFMQAQFPLHSGRILGVTGRVIITVLGLIIALLSATGVILWARKRRARALSVARAGSLASARGATTS
ncbi:MAG: PepSY-associated TM helix domain-containing protein [Polyangiales bacterium]